MRILRLIASAVGVLLFFLGVMVLTIGAMIASDRLGPPVWK